MSDYKGFPALDSARDLVAKLERDLKRMKGNPLDLDPAFDSFVTAESMSYWPDVEARFRHMEHGGIGCLLVACHVAIGIKHFRHFRYERGRVIRAGVRKARDRGP